MLQSCNRTIWRDIKVQVHIIKH